MAAQVEVKTSEGARAGGVGGRLHLSPLADSSNKSPIEGPSGTPSPLILAPEPSKPVPGPKPRLTPKPFVVEKNPTIRPIVAPKPHTKPRPEPTRPASYKPDPPSTPKPAPTKPANVNAHRPVSTTPKRPTPTSNKPAPKPALAQTPKPAVQPRKPGPPLSSGEPAKLTVLEIGESQGTKPALPQQRGLQISLAAEWSGTTPQQEERERREGKEKGAPIVRAKSMGFLNQAGREDERPAGRGKGDRATEAPAVVMRPQPRGSRPRPVSAIFLPDSAQTESSAPAPPSRWVGRRPLSADLTSKFESIGLSLHRRPGKADSKENTPERGREDDSGPARRKEMSSSMSPSASGPERKLKPAVPERKSEKKEQDEKEEDTSGGSIKRRISLLFDSSSSSSPSAGLPTARAESRPSSQPIPDTDIPVGVKQRIKKLTEDVPPAQNPSPKTQFKPRPLPSDLTNRFATEKSVELSSSSPSSLEKEGSRVHQQDGSEAHGKAEDSAVDLSDQPREGEEERAVFQFPQDQPAHSSVSQSDVSFEEQGVESEAQEACPSGGVQTVRAALFENVVERHSVQVVEEGGVLPSGGKDDGRPRRSLSMRWREGSDGSQSGKTLLDTVATPTSPLRVEHVFDTVPAVGETRAVVENVPSAQLEDKAMTLRSRRSGPDGPTRVEQVEERSPWSHPQKERDPLKGKQEAMPSPLEQAPRYLRVGSLKKWGVEQTVRTEVERGRQGEDERQKLDREMQGESERERQRERESEREEVAAPKRLKMLEGEDPPPKPRATYFALTGQMQEPLVSEDNVDKRGGAGVDFKDSTVMAGRWRTQGLLHRNPSLDAAVCKTPQSEASGLWLPTGREQPMERDIQRETDKDQESKTQRDIERVKQRELESQRANEMEKEMERQRQIEREKVREMERHLENERERQRQMERELLELENERKAERERVERQREMERQKETEKERQREVERQREMERQLLELEKQRQAERERVEIERQREIEFVRQREVERQREMERQRDIERQKEMERERLREIERQREAERQRELERQKEIERQIEIERQKMLEFEKQREIERERRLEIEKERQREMEKARQREMERQKEIERQREIERRKEMERQREVERARQEMERQKEIERQREMERQLLELEKQRQAERERAEREKEQERGRQLIQQQGLERGREMAGQEVMSPLRPRVLDLDSVSLGDRHPMTAQATDPSSSRVKQLSPRSEEPYRLAILDIDSFRSQTQPSQPSAETFPVAGFQGVDPGTGIRFQPHTPEIDGGRNVAPGRPVGRPSPVWSPSQQDFWEQRGGNSSSIGSKAPGGWAGPELPQKPINKPSLEQLLLRQEERLGAPMLVPERRWSGLPTEAGSPTAWAPSPRTSAPEPQHQVYTKPASSDFLDSPWWPLDVSAPAPQDQRGEPGAWRRPQGSQAKELTRMRSRSVSRRSAPAESSLEGPLSRVRSRSAHRERDRQSWEQLKQCVNAEDEGRDTDTLVHETDSQYGTWDTGLRTDDSLTPATPTSDSNLSSSPRKQTPPHTPGEPASSPSDLDTPDGLSPAPQTEETEPLPFPETSTTLLDSSVLRSRVQLSKKRSRRTLPSRAARHSAVLSVLPEGQGGASEDWRYRDSTEEKVESSKQEDSDTEEQAKGSEPRPTASQPQRVALFPGMDPSALKAQLKKRGDSDNQTDGASPSASQLSRSPKSPFLPRASRVLPPAGGKENGEESSPQWLRDLKSKKRLSQYDNDT